MDDMDVSGLYGQAQKRKEEETHSTLYFRACPFGPLTSMPSIFFRDATEKKCFF